MTAKFQREEGVEGLPYGLRYPNLALRYGGDPGCA